MDTFLVILGCLVAVGAIVGLYYLFKLLLGFIGYIVIFGVIFGVLGAVVGNYIAKEAIGDFMIYGAIGGGVIGLILAIYNSKAFIKTHLASEIIDSIGDTGDKIGTEYVARDQFGNVIGKVKKTGNGILGENYYEDDNGNQYKD